ncbi:hypothetical protein TrCOL_g737 [Triparma columacea]|uniref:RBR-type E3 ubiquitin transferase n=1 Tax=Triparma columacea TaxID=722753 RepID=A0A9W7G2Y8_9STRA|nr:hypothetical protein TrCOL_g737 [Triparma columacea]
MSDSEDDYVYDYSDASSDEGDEMKTSPQQAKSPQEGDSDDEDRKPAAKKSMDIRGEVGVKTPSSKNANANPNAPPAHGSGRKSYDHSPTGSDYLSPAKNPDGLKLMEAEQVREEMHSLVCEITDMLGISEAVATVLMRMHKWNKEALLNAYMNDSNATLSKAGVLSKVQGEGGGATSGSGTGNTCNICCDDDFASDEMYAMSCGHSFCRDCWRGFLHSKVGDGPSCIYATCPAAGCPEVITEVEVSDVSKDVLPKFSTYQLRSYVNLNKLARWCPGAGCTKVASSKTGFGNIKCDCGNEFCIRCGLEPHSPVTCPDLAKWEEKCQNESETANWILANTKKCPKCFTRIEKNQGCNHMVCQQCKFEFCWICLAAWNEHGASTGGYYKCNKFASEGDNPNDQSDAAKAKRELDRYLHYYQRFHAHGQAQKFAKKQLAQTEQRMVQLQDGNSDTSWIDVQFLKTATEQLIECRRVLKYTYTFAYYLEDKDGIKERFEHHQEMLEKFTERLSELSEMDLEKMDRTDVVNMTRVVDKFVKNILKYVDEGMDID